MKHTYDLAGFPPIPGQNAADAEQGFVAALMAADKLISNDNVEAADEDDDEEEVGLPQRYTMSTFGCKLLTFFLLNFFLPGGLLKSKPAAPEEPQRQSLNVPRAAQGRKRSPSPLASPDRSARSEGLSATGLSLKNNTPL